MQVTHGVEAVATADSLGKATRVLQSGPIRT